MSVQIALLGEVTAQVDRRHFDLGPPRQRCVLSALAVDAGRLVSTDRLMWRVWGADTPRRGRATLHSHISRLRKAFGDALMIAHRSDGYTLEMEQPDQAVDLLRFRALRAQARDTGDDTRTVALLADAVTLWRGEPLTGLSGEWVEDERDRWQQERWAAEHDLVDAQLRLGQGEELVAQLSARTAQHPRDERAAGQYMLALHRAGRAADALDHYRRVRERLVTELGTDPGTLLQDLHQQILAADPCLLPAPASPATEPVVIPRQLPAAPALFVGRRNELDRLDAALSTGPATGLSEEGAALGSMPDEVPCGGTMLISAIGGAGGIGKTWLALRWAYRNLRRFPDGQLFVDLRGFSLTGHSAQPGDVLGGFLGALGVDRDRQPTDPDHRADLYRSLVADKRMLIVLDNAVTTDQITPLLPGGHHCTVLITSRNRLRGLIARHGARPIHLDVFTSTEASALLTIALGPARAAADTRAVAELLEFCGGFPLALGLIAARAAADSHLSLRDVIAELRDLGLDALDAEDPTASLPTVLSWSLRHLTDQQRETFALLGIAPDPDIGLPAAADLLGLPKRETHAVLRALADASLIDRTPSNRYVMHDLVRAYAATIAGDLPGEVRETALRRLLGYYTHTAHAAHHLLEPHPDPVALDPPMPGVHPHLLPDAPAAWAWLDTEHACLLAALHTATTQTWHSTVWHLAWALDIFHFRRGHRHDRLTAWQAGADAASYLPDPTTRTLAHQYLGHAHAELSHHEDALDHLHQALTIAEHHHDLIHQAQAHHALAQPWRQQRDIQQALNHAQHALNLHRSLDDPVWKAMALTTMGGCTARLGDYDTARAHFHAALTLYRDHHDPDGEADTLDNLGYINHHRGHHTQSIKHYLHALTLYRDTGNTFRAANTLEFLGHPYTVLGQTEQARTVWREALQLYREQGRHDGAIRVQRQLDNLEQLTHHTLSTE